MWGRASSVPLGPERLAERRRQRRRRVRIAFSILFLLLFGAGIYGLNQPATRIAEITVYGASQFYAEYARSAMQGKYLGLIPRDSTFFFPATRIREGILAAHPEFAAVSFFREGLTGLSIKIHERVPVARWCGLAPTPDVEEYCYVFDASGYLFAADASTTPKLNPFSLYGRLASDTLEPLRATLAHAEELPAAFDFARQLDTLGGSVSKIVIRDDEVDAYLKSGTPSNKSDLVLGTRVTYVLGREQDAFTALVSSRENMNLADGSIDYVDLRFGGKVYMKRR